jgi:hypothetical protein
MAEETSGNVSVGKPTDIYDFEPLNDLKKRIEEELGGMDTNSREFLRRKLAEEQEALRKAAELAAQKQREAEERKRQEEERKEKEAAERRIREEADRAKQEKLRREEEERQRKENERRLAEEKARKAEEERERDQLARIEAEKLAQKQKEAEENQRKINELKEQYNSKLAELASFELLEQQVNDIREDMQQLSQLHASKSEETIDNLTEKIALVNKIIDFINKNKPKTVADIKSTPEYNRILRDIIFIMDSYNNKSNEQKQAIGELPAEYSIKFSKIQELYNAALSNDENMKTLIENNSNENTPISTTQYDDIISYIRTVINTEDNLSLLENKFSDLYEIIVGTARVVDRFKPNDGDNTSPIISKTEQESYNAKNYLDSLLSTQSAGGTCGGNTNTNIIQKGGYDYEDVIKVVNNGGKNYLEIGEICKTAGAGAGAGEEQNRYGPFYGIYPPQFNNFHIYYNMFGIYPYGEYSKATEDKASIDKYDKLLENSKIASESATKRNFSMANIDNPKHNLMKKLQDGGSVVIFGFGFSGSGKTYALIEGSVTEINTNPDSIKYDPSILEQFIKDNAENITSVEFLELYPLGISHNPHKAILDITTENTKKIDKNTSSEIVNMEKIKTYATQYGIDDFNSKYGREYSTITNLYKEITGDISYDKISTRIKLLERHRISKLRILATPNNDKSSRSFLQITLNLKPLAGFESKKPKLVFFDMPGTENTVRIKTEFLDKQIFTFDKSPSLLTKIEIEKLVESGATNNGNIMINKRLNKIYTYSNLVNSSPLYNIEFYNPQPYIINGIRINYFQKLNNIEKDNKTCFKEIIKIFKYFYMQKYNFDAINVKIQGGDDVVAFDSLEFALFINGYDVKRAETFEDTYNNIPENTIIYFLNNVKFETIYNDFNSEKGFLNKTDNKPLPEKIYVDTKNTNKYCKIGYQLDEDDKKNLLNIFNITVGTPQTTLGKIDPKIYFDSNKTNEITTDSKNPKYFANPLVKYITFILEYIEFNYKKPVQPFDGIMKVSEMMVQVKIRASVFFIYKYINFIVNQGRSIVTNLEHLKFFFLTRTGIINTYNREALEEAEKSGTADKNKSFYSSDSKCITIKTQPKEYTKPTSIGNITTIQERVNVGNMTQYGLIDILQQLSESPDLNRCECKAIEAGQKYNVNLLKATDTAKSNTILGAIFIMFTNYKIFLNDKKISDLLKGDKSIGDKLSTLCTAAKDTAEFTQSISSTSTNKQIVSKAKPTIDIAQQPPSSMANRFPNIFNSILKPEAVAVAVAQGGKRKFNLNQLLNNNNQHNQKHKTHKIKRFSSMKNILKNKKLFSTKTKKNTK